MRIAHVGSFSPESAEGPSRGRAALVAELARLGLDMELWQPQPAASEVRERRANGVTIFDVPTQPSPMRNLWRATPAAVDFLQRHGREADLVHLHSVFQPENICFARYLRRYMVSPHGGYDRQVLSGRHRLAKAAWMHLWELPYLRRACCLRAVSPAEVEELRRLGLHVPVEMIPNGCDPDLIFCEATPPSRGTHWLFLGRLAVRHKGLDLLVAAYARLCRRAAAPPPKLIVAGPDFRGGLGVLKALCADLGVANRVDFPGPVFGQAKLDLLRNAAALLQTSRWEGLPLTVLEAMAVGRPVMVTPQTNVGPWVSECKVGWVVRPTVEGITQGLAELQKTPPQVMDRMAEAARALVRAEFAWPQIARRMKQLYERLIARGCPGE